MIKNRIYTLFFGFLFFLMIGCTPNSNTFYNRQWQPVSTKYNVLFHSEEAFAVGKKKLDEKFEDDFSKILLVEPIATQGETKLKGKEDPDFTRAEEKAIKTIQKHSMVYKGRQRNYKIDDAYMMLGKARYFNERFIPALEAFNHLLDSYGETNRLGDAAIWREKVNLRLGRDEVALKNLKILIDTLKMKRSTEVDAMATLSQAYINLKQYGKAIEELEKAAKLTRNKTYRGRYYFIAAQLNERLHHPELAVMNYNKVIKLNWKIPRRLWIEAQGGIARNKEFTEEELEDYLGYLTRLESRYEHKTFLDVLYYNHAKLLEKNDRRKEAITLYEKSIEKNTANFALKAGTYQNLAELYFSEKKYLKAFNNFDDALKLIKENTLDYLHLKRKKDHLKQVALLENTVKQSNRLLRLEHMTQAQREVFFKAEKDSLAQVEKEKSSQELVTSSFTSSFGSQGSASNFYFYNPATVAYGKQNFKKKWGDRTLQDNWRTVRSAAVKKVVDVAAEVGSENVLKKNQKEEKLEALPTTKEEWDERRTQRNEALYELGVLYQNKFNDYELATNRLQKLLELNPSSDLSLLANYELYKIFRHLGKSADVYEKFIVSNYPDSDYALMVTGKIPANAKEKALEEMYEKASKLLVDKKYKEVVSLVDGSNFNRGKDDLFSKLLFLKARAVARLDGIESYQKELKMIQEKYPKSPVVKEIDTILVNLSSLLLDKAFTKSAKSWKIVIRNFPKNHSNIIKEMREKLEVLSNSLKISEDLYNREEVWLVIHHIKDSDAAMSVIKELESVVPEGAQMFMISSENYQKVQVYKNIDKYLNE